MGIPALIVVATLLTAAGAPDAPAKQSPDSTARKVTELRQERIAALKAVVEIGTHLETRGAVPIRNIAEARMDLLSAELDAAANEADRISLYKEALVPLKQYEAMAQAAKEAGRGTDLDVLAIKANRLQVEIWLELAESKAAR
jgi:hypothetical protein